MAHMFWPGPLTLVVPAAPNLSGLVTGNGTNCEMEMAHACRLAGADEVEITHIYKLLSGQKKLGDYHFLNLPGGFLDGDDLGSAMACAHRMRTTRSLVLVV